MATKRLHSTEKKVRATGRVVVHADPGLFTVPDHERIARRAYDLFTARGAEHGHDVEDWLAAERELIGR